MSENPTKFDNAINWLKNQPLVAGLLVIGAVIIVASTFVEAVPQPDTVGYERFVFVFSFESAPASVIGVYAWIEAENIYELLAYVTEHKGELPNVLADDLH
jgi:hypothetical protein